MSLQKYQSHLALFFAAVLWGLMSPVGKIVLDNGITGFELATFRMVGAAICFWITSFFVKKEKVPKKDLLLLFFAALFGIVCNQGCFIIGLSLTSPIDSSIITTTAPIVTLILAAAFLKEKATFKKVSGVLMGTLGALILIFSNLSNVSSENGNIWGNLLCLSAQISFSIYLTFFKGLISRYSIFTLMKWMFTYASLCFIPLSLSDFIALPYTEISVSIWLGILYVIIGGTFLAYIFVMYGQKRLSSTVVSMYNYVQPIVGTIVSILLGLGIFTFSKVIASALIFTGVYLVTIRH